MPRHSIRFGPKCRWTMLACVACTAACAGAERDAPDPFSASGQLIALSGGRSGAAYACFTCHGLRGEGNGAGAPRLAGLGFGYLNRQLDDYAVGRRRHPEMEWVARQLNAGDRQAVAAFYAAMQPRLAGRPPLPAHPLYARGDPARGLLACASCHGEAGEGVGTGNPPLAGQPTAYLAAQLHKWQAGKRRNDPLNMMLAISRRLAPDEVRTLAAYASSLPGLRPVSPEESPSARRGDPRNDASAPPPREAEPGS